MEEEQILEEVEKAKEFFGIVCNKCSGALTVEVIKQHLEKHGFCVSSRDVFIKGVNSELDLIVVKKSAAPKHGIIYEPSDVVCALEIKNQGAFGEKTTLDIKKTFGEIKSKNPDILCCYLTVLERETYKNKVTPEKLGYPAFTMFYYKGKNRWATGDWTNCLKEMKGKCQYMRDP
jgi:hypothetical protein